MTRKAGPKIIPETEEEALALLGKILEDGINDLYALRAWFHSAAEDLVVPKKRREEIYRYLGGAVVDLMRAYAVTDGSEKELQRRLEYGRKRLGSNTIPDPTAEIAAFERWRDENREEAV